MRRIVRKVFMDFEKEAAWLNNLSAKGLALVDYSWCRYALAECAPGEYLYHIELLKNLPSHPESQQYIRFMEETGAEHVASYFRWVYFRKKAADGPFELFSDRSGLIAHYRRVAAFFGSVLILEAWGAVMQLPAMHSTAYYRPLGVFIIVFASCVSILLLVQIGRCMRKIGKLKKEQRLYE